MGNSNLISEISSIEGLVLERRHPYHISKTPQFHQVTGIWPFGFGAILLPKSPGIEPVVEDLEYVDIGLR